MRENKNEKGQKKFGRARTESFIYWNLNGRELAFLVLGSFLIKRCFMVSPKDQNQIFMKLKNDYIHTQKQK